MFLDESIIVKFVSVIVFPLPPTLHLQFDPLVIISNSKRPFLCLLNRFPNKNLSFQFARLSLFAAKIERILCHNFVTIP
jgi:hypothetical protein